MSVTLLPRLSSAGVARIMHDADAPGPTPVRSRAVLEEHAAMLSFAASGGHRSEDAAIAIGQAIRSAAATAGFPDNPSQVARSKFDHETSICLASRPELASGEGLRDDVWAYLATVIVPDVVSWRFADKSASRFEGGVRNALQRLWVRGMTLDRGPDHPDRWGLVRALSEDAAVQIFERASIGGSRPLAVAMAEGWVRTATRIGRSAMEPVMRRAIKVFRLRNEVIDLAGIATESRDELVSALFAEASGQMAGSK